MEENVNLIKNNQKGITLIVLVVTIVLMLTLTSVTVYFGTDNIENSKMVNFVAYMQAIQAKVDFIAEYENYSSYGTALTGGQTSVLEDILSSSSESFTTTSDSTYLRFFSSSAIKSQLELEGIDDEIIVDFNTREVISLNGVKYEGARYYTQYNLPGGETLKQQVEIERNLTYENVVYNINGLNATISLTNIGLTNATISYGKMDSNNVIKWTVISNRTTKGETITTQNITESGTYYLRIIDNTTGEDNADTEGNYPSIELRLTNAPKLEGALTDLSTTYNYSDINNSANWAFATDTTDTTNLVYYVWIPRFAYKTTSSGSLDELQFLRGTSDVTSSGGYINSTNWTIPEAFTNEGIQKTGVWVQVSTPNQTRHRYN